MNAKDVSLWIGKIGAIVVLLTLVILKAIGILPDLTIMDAVVVSITIAALFSDVSINLFLEKIFPGKA